jgi:hypothetical protein
MTQLYFPFIEEEIKKFYNTLNEKEKRLYAAVEAIKIGYGGITYISEIVNCSRKTVALGIRELFALSDEKNANKRIRLPGGGRKPYYKIHENIDEQFLDILNDYTAGSPMNEKIKWTNLTPKEIAEKLEDKHEVRVSEIVIRQLLRKHNFKRRKAQKSKTAKQVKNRDHQFKNISKIKTKYIADACNPVISMDTKKKEWIGNFYRDGRLYTQEVIKTNDHDFNSLAEGIVIPHGIYDLKQNSGYINIGTSKDTSEFACDSIMNWWKNQGKFDYPNATSILILCDSGGSNNSRHYIFKQDIQKLANKIGVEIRIAHYPPYTSKYNPIEHRLFPHLTRACQGVIFKSVELVKELMSKTKTTTGLKIKVEIIDKIYQTGRHVDDSFKENMKLIFDDFLPNWNYKAVPQSPVNG